MGIPSLQHFLCYKNRILRYARLLLCVRYFAGCDAFELMKAVIDFCDRLVLERTGILPGFEQPLYMEDQARSTGKGMAGDENSEMIWDYCHSCVR